jgi:hypothetical protein
MFSIAPLLMIVIAWAGPSSARTARGEISSSSTAQGAQGGRRRLSSAGWPERADGVGLLFLFIGATSVFAELQDALDRIWRAPARVGQSGLWRLVRARLLSFGMILAIGFLLMVSLAFSAGLAALAQRWDPLFGGWQSIAQTIDVGIGLALSTVVFARSTRRCRGCASTDGRMTRRTSLRSSPPSSIGVIGRRHLLRLRGSRLARRRAALDLLLGADLPVRRRVHVGLLPPFRLAEERILSRDRQSGGKPADRRPV